MNLHIYRSSYKCVCVCVHRCRYIRYMCTYVYIFIHINIHVHNLKTLNRSGIRRRPEVMVAFYFLPKKSRWWKIREQLTLGRWLPKIYEEGKWKVQNKLPCEVTFESLRDGLGRALPLLSRDVLNSRQICKTCFFANVMPPEQITPNVQ